jgi:sulfatase modifying factor 1
VPGRVGTPKTLNEKGSMKSLLIRSHLSLRLDDWALVGMVAMLSGCSSGGGTSDGSGGATTGDKGGGGAAGTAGSGGAIGSGGVGTGGATSNGGATGSGGITGSGGAIGTGGATGSGGVIGSRDSGGVGGGVANDAAVSSGDSGGAGSNTGPTPSCAPGGLGMTDCGAGRENCCTSLAVSGGTYNRTYRNNGAGPTGQADPATVSNFRLDKYLVTVGRYRQFVAAWSGGWRPAAGSGKHAYLSGGGLANTAGGIETGWDASWSTDNVRVASANLTGGSFCDSTHATWTAASTGGRENLPINCVNWYESYAFCIWDGGTLPSEAEWEYAAAGGSEQRQYPWGTAAPAAMSQYAIYGSFFTANSTALAPVGTATMGAGLFGQLDLAGEIWEWNLDWKQNYVSPCTDCVNLTAASFRIVRGDNFGGSVANLMPTVRGGDIAPDGRDSNFGVRCSRAP